MKKVSINIIVLIIIDSLFFVTNSILAQNTYNIYHMQYEKETNTTTHTYGNPIEFTTQEISSDYGKRRCNCSLWHRGVDFQNDAPTNPISRWDHFLSLNNCTIRKLKGGAGYKYIITQGTETGHIHHFGYGHLFDHFEANPINRKGDLVLTKLNERNNNYAILDLSSGEAFGPVTGTVTYNYITYNVTTDVTQNSVLGVIGISKNPTEDYGYQHLHVYMFNDINLAVANHNNIFNDRDPLQFISHVNTTYNVAISNDNNVNGNHIITSSGSNAISLKVRYTMNNAGINGSRFNTAVMDIDNVDIYIKPSYKNDEDNAQWGSENSNYQLITGEYVKSYLSHGARLSSNIYPVTAAYNHDANPLHNTVINLVGNTYGDFHNTGIDPFAYSSTNNHPYDDYYFSDFYTGVHQDYQLGGNFVFAPCNEKAKYHDGSYYLYAKVITDRDDVFTSIDNNQNPNEIIIDNASNMKLIYRHYPTELILLPFTLKEESLLKK